MIICGLKLTHDGSVAVIKDGKLVFSIEIEKLNNNGRYAGIEEMTLIPDILKTNGYSMKEIEYFAVDGWGGDNQGELAIQPRLEICDGYNRLMAYDNEKEYKLNVNLYEEKTLKADVLEKKEFNGLYIDGKDYKYSSYLHVAGHIMSAYCTSQFAKRGESSYVLVWDGGMYPRLYFFDAAKKAIENMGPIFLLIGNIYSIFSQHFGPFKVDGSFAKDNLSVAGKVMAYIAKGKVKDEMFDIFDSIYQECYRTPMGFANMFANEFKKRIENRGYKDEDILASMHVYIERMLIDKLLKKKKRFPRNCDNLCIAGGCALNIKWNSAIRNAGEFKSVYVAPFPNDSGSAIGAACCLMIEKMGKVDLDWSVYSGPEVICNEPCKGWKERECSIQELAELIHIGDEPVVFLNGRAELGPRALGNRSIIASASNPAMKDILNKIKKREGYRPVSPICMEERAKKIFNPGTSDPYMLFDHIVSAEWKEKILAICHLDGTARLQTVNKNENARIYELLEAYEKMSGIPLLCNTSANYNGCGFFPDVYSATKWGEVNYVWCDGHLFEKNEKIYWK